MRRTAARAPAFWLLAFACASCGSPKPASAPASGDSDDAAAPEPSTSATAQPSSLYERLGRKEALAGVVEELTGNVLADNRIAKLFEKAHKDPGHAVGRRRSGQGAGR